MDIFYGKLTDGIRQLCLLNKDRKTFISMTYEEDGSQSGDYIATYHKKALRFETSFAGRMLLKREAPLKLVFFKYSNIDPENFTTLLLHLKEHELLSDSLYGNVLGQLGSQYLNDCYFRLAPNSSNASNFFFHSKTPQDVLNNISSFFSDQSIESLLSIICFLEGSDDVKYYVENSIRLSS